VRKYGERRKLPWGFFLLSSFFFKEPVGLPPAPVNQSPHSTVTGIGGDYDELISEPTYNYIKSERPLSEVRIL
jgi:hypothetical protein